MDIRVVLFCFSTYVIAIAIPQISRPDLKGPSGEYCHYPGLAFQPNPEGPSTLIRYNKVRPSTYDHYINLTMAALSAYQTENWNPNQVEDCGSVSGYRSPDRWEMPCRFDIAELGPECVAQNTFGFEDGQPCVLFSMERVYRWIPVAYDNSSVPDTIRGMWSQFYVTLKCEGDDASSRDNLGDVTYYPPNGFHFKYFPDIGQPSWKSPLVFVRFENPNPAVLLRINCKLYASDIIHSRILDTGTVSFELLVD